MKQYNDKFASQKKERGKNPLTPDRSIKYLVNKQAFYTSVILTYLNFRKHTSIRISFINNFNLNLASIPAKNLTTTVLSASNYRQ